MGWPEQLEGINKGWIILGCVLIWPVGLALLLVWGLKLLFSLDQEQRRKQCIDAWNDSHRNDVCRLGGRYGLVVKLARPHAADRSKLELKLKLLSGTGKDAAFESRSIPLPPERSQGRSAANALRRQLLAAGLELPGALAVESQAVHCAEEWVKKLSWLRETLTTLLQMEQDLQTTLSIATGNALLEPAIPQLKEAQIRFREERLQLHTTVHEAEVMLRQLMEFLSVPPAVQRVMSFDADPVRKPRRMKELRQSFNDVVLLNQVFLELSAGKLA